MCRARAAAAAFASFLFVASAEGNYQKWLKLKVSVTYSQKFSVDGV